MEIGQAERIELADEVRIERQWLVLATVVGDAKRRQANADPVRPPHLGDGLSNLQHQPTTVLDGAAISVAAAISARLQKLLQQVTVRRMDLDAIEAGFHGAVGGMNIALDHTGDLLCPEGAWGRAGHAVEIGRGDLDVGRHRRRCDRQLAVGLVRRMRQAAHVPEL